MIARFLGEKGGIFQGKIFQTDPPTPDPEFFTKSPLPRKTKTDGTLKNCQKKRDNLTKKHRGKNGQHFPLNPNKIHKQFGVRGSFV